MIPTEDEFMKCVPPATVQLKKDKLEASSREKINEEDPSGLRTALLYTPSALKESQDVVAAQESSALRAPSSSDCSGVEDIAQLKAALQELQEKVVALEAAPSTLSSDDVLKDGDVRKLQAELLGAQCALKEAQEALATQQVPTRSTLLSVDARVREDVHDLFLTELPVVLAEEKPNAEDMASLAETVAKLKIELDESRSALKLLQASVSTWRSKELFHVFCAFDWDDTGYICADELLVTMNTVLTMTLTTTMMKTVDDEYDWCQWHRGAFGDICVNMMSLLLPKPEETMCTLGPCHVSCWDSVEDIWVTKTGTGPPK